MTTARWMGRAAAVLCVLGGTVAEAADAPDWVRHGDPDFDVVARPTDAGLTAPFDPAAHRLIELRETTLGRWCPTDPQVDLYDGVYAPWGGFVRLDLSVDGLVNPPGSTDPTTFDPFRYGDHPVYGFLELDMDLDHNTGGEVSAPGYRFLANIARFGGLPEGEEFDDRLAAEASDCDDSFLSEPFIERSGEEFHLAFLGDLSQCGDVEEVAGDGDLTFEAGETWNITGKWFHRAHGFEPYSLATGGAVPGEYAPECQLRFEHDPDADATAISLVFPLDNSAAAAMRGESPEPLNHDPSDQASVREALRDLRISAELVYAYPTGEPEEILILGWREAPPGAYLEPADWRVTALFGTTYTEPGHGFVWTDAYPNVLRGNVDGEHGVDGEDRHEIDEYIEEHDADDGDVDGCVLLDDFARGYGVYDLNYDGMVDPVDWMLVSTVGDGDLDGDVDLADFAVWQRCRGAVGHPLAPPCALADLDSDGDVDLHDIVWFAHVLEGPGGG